MKRYHFNREERFYCSVIMYAVQDNHKIAVDIFKNIKCADKLEVYVETSIIRDHWMRLGIPGEKNITCLNNKREEYLKELCSLMKIDFNLITNKNDYRSKNGFIQSPGNWKISKDDDENIRNLRAIFNMRQDLLIIEKNNLHFVEAKLESGNSKQQIKNMLLLKNLLDKNERKWACIEEFKNIDNVYLYYIKRNSTPLRVDDDCVKMDVTIISWKDVFKKIHDENVCKKFNMEDHEKIVYNLRD